MNLNILLIDDENKARKLLEKLLLNSFSDKISNIYKASNLKEGVEIIKQTKPDIVFLDIEMPEHSGLEIFKLLDDDTIDFQLIFVTAYNQYAIKAFKLSAIDYILKPIDKKELTVAFSKASKNIKNNNHRNSLKEIKNALNHFSINKIALEIPKGISFVSHDDIYYLEADGMYTKVYFSNNKFELICKPLGYFEEQLKLKSSFYRTHRSYLVNLRHLKELIKKDGYQVILDDDTSIPITKNKQKEFMTVIEEFFNN
ncbi:LytR/AlgR family response regulator transcription factor [Polaribacter porphyrae]|uniref:DNA-binding response regulator n=1 Tax=Polaribacter porphyrae TaxID=1137780 RepID=A0A2S7WLN8_9FLAO|nr:LytTR family DNA-binding domain-containing protein [Polaribacter porphyrae]PQJ78530.1 DNA-binding response regulator [Polaribacter porphyrae]